MARSLAACLASEVVVPQTDGVESTESERARSKHHRGTTMDHYAGIDVSLECSSVCVVEASGKIVRGGGLAPIRAFTPVSTGYGRVTRRLSLRRVLERDDLRSNRSHRHCEAA